jgi:hypothetical protein
MLRCDVFVMHSRNAKSIMPASAERMMNSANRPLRFTGIRRVFRVGGAR